MSGGLLTTSVGSFPKPAYLQQARNRYAAGRLPKDELAELERRATREVIALQEELGIDILVDGEMNRGDMVAFFAEQLDSMKIGGLVRSYGNRYYHRPSITDKLRWQGPMTVDAWRFAQGLTDRPVKGMLTGPYTMVDWSFDEHYDSRREAVLDMASVVRREAEELVRAGAVFVQLDEPAASARPEEMELVSEALGIITQGLGVKTITHICYGDFARVFQQIATLPVDQLDLEMANSNYDLLDLVRQHKDGFRKELAMGVVDVHSHAIETVDQVKEGIKKGLEVLPPERLYIDPDCGIKTRTWQEAEAKLRVMVQAVREVKEELGLDGR